jgi:hypothetical protein
MNHRGVAADDHIHLRNHLSHQHIDHWEAGYDDFHPIGDDSISIVDTIFSQCEPWIITITLLVILLIVIILRRTRFPIKTNHLQNVA